MMYSLRYTPEAMRDMDAVWDGVYEASKSVDIADKYVNEFADTISEKKQFPLSGIPLLYRGLFTGFYSVNFKKYKAFYRVNDTYIEVIRIIMAKRDYMTILFGEPDEE
ncbi:MAG: type II toxin-antitoxin system RelE/ParE family toxin [Lachnospiraceae bacterium]|nr:type II toxin-antitoxin system RelE/ParE family toxin [Lachnospiraceae bacterium]